MSADLVHTLPIAQRLALSYAPRRARDAVLSLMALEQRLAGILRQGGEPVIAQMKLAWWREMLAKPPGEWPMGEPLLAFFHNWPGEVAQLIDVVDGWEVLLGEELDEAALGNFAAGRAAGWLTLAKCFQVDHQGVEKAAGEWALHDLFLHVAPAAERDALHTKLMSLAWQTPHVARPLRPLAVLHGLAKRSLRRNGAELLDSPSAMLLAARLGILGR